MSTHVMVDIETLGAGHRALICSIGAVKFNATEILDRFHVGIDPVDAQRCGLKLDAGTIMWWFDPKRDQARKELIELPKVDLYAALDGFAIWCHETPEAERGALMGKGATFDNALLRDAYDTVGLTYPFTYRQDECYRTLANRCPKVGYVQQATAHNGLADAESQALHLQEICKVYGFEL